MLWRAAEAQCGCRGNELRCISLYVEECPWKGERGFTVQYSDDVVQAHCVEGTQCLVGLDVQDEFLAGKNELQLRCGMFETGAGSKVYNLDATDQRKEDWNRSGNLLTLGKRKEVGRMRRGLNTTGCRTVNLSEVN